MLSAMHSDDELASRRLAAIASGYLPDGWLHVASVVLARDVEGTEVTGRPGLGA
jgi:hypothetical protein